MLSSFPYRSYRYVLNAGQLAFSTSDVVIFAISMDMSYQPRGVMLFGSCNSFSFHSQGVSGGHLALPDAKSIFNHQSQSKQLLWESTRNSKNIGIIFINWAIMGLKAAALLTLLCLTTLGLSTVTRDIYSRWLNAALTSSGAYSEIGYTNCYPDLAEVGVEELISGLESGTWTSVELTKVCCHHLS